MVTKINCEQYAIIKFKNDVGGSVVVRAFPDNNDTFRIFTFLYFSKLNPNNPMLVCDNTQNISDPIYQLVVKYSDVIVFQPLTETEFYREYAGYFL